MPNSVSAKKSHRQSLKRRNRNRAQRSTLRSAVKKVREAAAAGDAAEARKLLVAVTRKLDRAATKNLVHKNNAARTKSRLAKLVNGIAAE